MSHQKFIAYSGCIFLCFSGSPYAQGTLSPSTEQFMNMLSTCAAGVNVEFEGDLLGSIESLYSGQRTQGYAAFKSETTFMNSLPESMRLEGYRIYTDCIRSILDDPAANKAKIQRALLEGYSRDTPLDKVVEAFGKPHKIKALYDEGGRIYAEGSPVSAYWFSGQKVDFFVYAADDGWNLASGVYVGWRRDVERDSSFDEAILPYLGLGLGDKIYDTLDDFPVEEMMEICPFPNDVSEHARFSYFTSDLCYFGAPGGYMNYQFTYQPNYEEFLQIEGCNSTGLDFGIHNVLNNEIRSCGYYSRLRPVLGIVYTTEGILPDHLSDITMEWIYNFAQ